MVEFVLCSPLTEGEVNKVTRSLPDELKKGRFIPQCLVDLTKAVQTSRPPRIHSEWERRWSGSGKEQISAWAVD